MLNREVAFLKNRTTSYIVFGLVGLAVFGLFSKVFNNPVGFFKGIAIIIGVVAVVFLLIKLIYKPSPAKREQQAFRKAAKQSARRKQQKDPKPQSRVLMKTQKKNPQKENQFNINQKCSFTKKIEKCAPTTHRN